MSPFKSIVTALTVLSLACATAAPPRNEARTRAIDLISEGQTLEKQGNNQAAYQKYYESAQLAPSPSAYYHLGRAARLAGNTDIARQWLNYALQMNPSFELAKVELLQLKQGGGSEAPVVETVSAEMRGDIRPGSAAAMNTPMNVDALRREVVTMQSLTPPESRETAEAQQAPDIMEISGGEPVGDTKNVVAAGPASPGDIELPGRTDDANSEISDVLSPTLESTEQGNASLPSLMNAPAGTEIASADGKPTQAQLNDAAFGEESQKDPGSKGYNTTNEIVLGTFAFHREKGDTYRKANRWEDAAVEYKTALEIEPNDTKTRALLAEMYGRIGAPDRAETQFAKAKTQAPNDDEIYYKEGNAYFDNQEYDLAIGSYRKALNLNPDNKLALNNMGVSYMEKKEYPVAAEKFKQVLELDPGYAMAILNLGIIYDEHIVDKQQALEYYDRYLALDGPRATEVRRWADAIRAQASP